MRRVTAYHRDWLECCAGLPGGQRFEHGGALVVDSGVAWPIFNGGIGGSARDAAAGVGALKDAGRPFFWWMTADADPRTEGSLAEAGLTCFARDEPWQEAERAALPPAPAPDGVSLLAVDDEAGHRQWAAAATAVYEFPPPAELGWIDAGRRGGWSDLPWRQWIAIRDGVPVGTTMLFEGGGVAGLWAVGVLPEHRRAGIGSLLTLAPLADAGAPIAGFSATPVGSRLYESLGFRPTDVVTRWLWLPPDLGVADDDLAVARGAVRADAG